MVVWIKWHILSWAYNYKRWQHFCGTQQPFLVVWAQKQSSEWSGVRSLKSNPWALVFRCSRFTAGMKPGDELRDTGWGGWKVETTSNWDMLLEMKEYAFGCSLNQQHGETSLFVLWKALAPRGAALPHQTNLPFTRTQGLIGGPDKLLDPHRLASNSWLSLTSRVAQPNSPSWETFLVGLGLNRPRMSLSVPAQEGR